MANVRLLEIKKRLMDKRNDETAADARLVLDQHLALLVICNPAGLTGETPIGVEKWGVIEGIVREEEPIDIDWSSLLNLAPSPITNPTLVALTRPED